MGPGEGCDQCNGSNDGLGNRNALVRGSASANGRDRNHESTSSYMGNGRPLRVSLRKPRGEHLFSAMPPIVAGRRPPPALTFGAIKEHWLRDEPLLGMTTSDGKHKKAARSQSDDNSLSE